MAAELDKLLETLSAFIYLGKHDEIEKVKMKQSIYDECTEMHKMSITVDEDVTTIFGVPIEIDDSIVNEYEIILKCG